MIRKEGIYLKFNRLHIHIYTVLFYLSPGLSGKLGKHSMPSALNIL